MYWLYELPVLELHILSMLLVIALIFNAGFSSYKSFSRRRFLLYLISLLLLLIVDAIGIVIMQNPAVFPHYTRKVYISRAFFLDLLSVTVYLWIIYSESEEDPDIVGDEFSKKRLFIPFAGLIVMNTLNYPTKMLFSFDRHLRYVHHFWFYVEYILLCSAIVIEATRKYYFGSYEPDPVKKKKTYEFARYAWISVPIFLILSFILGESMATISLVLATLYVYIAQLNNDICIDPLTGINNRQQLDGYIKQKMAHHQNKLYLLMMDVDKFKEINDTYGHVEGDRALILISRSLNQEAGSLRPAPFIVRYGGDEFTMVIEATQDDIDIFCQRLHRNLRTLNHYEHLPYHLSISIGVKCYDDDPDVRSVKELIKAADQKLYEIKRLRKKVSLEAEAVH